LFYVSVIYDEDSAILHDVFEKFDERRQVYHHTFQVLQHTHPMQVGKPIRMSEDTLKHHQTLQQHDEESVNHDDEFEKHHHTFHILHSAQ
jgi:hypothetical protein